MGIVQSDLCTFCNLTKEDIEHLFFSCSFSLKFWKEFELHWKKCTNSNINLTSQDVILGISGNNKITVLYLGNLLFITVEEIT